ncbi:DUF559 domain-containing protein [Amycolatopsis suaedae]|uniref:DUF559 domain-containing protein n=1 Tax=Amycolatopsis suaedae TaxID=2510978 RepID=A0A4Q7J541_9PSEU|nr:DUF559 domain-containing protein [Amycolatopsis suaedae]
MHGVAAAERAPVEVLVPYARRGHKRPGLRVHNGRVEDQDVVEIAGLRTVALDYALADVLARDPGRLALACADQAMAMTPEPERGEFREWIEVRITDRPDPRGRKRARILLDLVTGLPESPSESALLLTLTEAGYPPPQPQFSVRDLAGQEIYRLDFAWAQWRIAVEYDGYEAHEGRQDLDAARDADLARRGWIVIRATAADLRDPTRLLAAVASAFARRGVAA